MVGIGSLVAGIIVGYTLGYSTFTHQPSPTTAQNTRGSGAYAGGMMRGSGNGAGGFLTGTVAAQDSGSITLNTRDGSSRVVLITPNTSVSKSVNGALTDVSVGSTIIVSGSTNSDGSISANLIQLHQADATTQQGL